MSRGDETTDQGNVHAMIRDLGDAESILRNALSRVSEIRSRGLEPEVIVMVVEADCVPAMARTDMLMSQLASASVVLQHETFGTFTDFYNDIADSQSEPCDPEGDG